MKKILNREFKMSIQNLLCAEEHIVEMIANSTDKNTKENLLGELIKLKTQRNKLLNLKNEEENNKWCLVKHLLLSEYHLTELVNDINENNINKIELLDTSSYINKALERVINTNLKTNCGVCIKDLKIMNFIKFNKER